MTIHEKAVVRFEAVCDECGEFVGEYAERRQAAEAITVHRLRDHGPGEADIDTLVHEAERGYDVEELRSRRSRRRGRVEVVPVRMPPELKDAVEQRAEDDSTSVSEVVREALRQTMSPGEESPRS